MVKERYMKQQPNPNTQATKTPEQNEHSRKQLKLVILLVAICILLVGAVSVVVVGALQNKEKKATAKEALSEAVAELRDLEQDMREVRSQLGMKAKYDSSLVHARGQVTTSAEDGRISGIEYSGDDLATSRSYSILKFGLKSHDESDISYFRRPELIALTNARQDYFGTRMARYPGLSKTEIAIREFDPTKDGAMRGSLVSHVQEVINGVTYEKLLYRIDYAPDVVGSYALQYITVQHDRPFKAELWYFPSTKEGDILPFIKIIESLEYAPPDADAQYLTTTLDTDPNPVAIPMVAGISTVFGSSTKTVNTPKTLKGDTDLTVVAKNQLAVVRVGAIVCYDFSLLGLGGSPAASFKNSCGGGIGSGAIMSEDGKVSTNGHVTDLHVRDTIPVAAQIAAVKKDFTDIDKYLNYFTASGMLDQATASKLSQELRALKPEAFEVIVSLIARIPDSMFKIESQSREYAIQLSNDPIRMDLSGDKLTFAYKKNIVKAKYIDSNFDSSMQGSPLASTASDVALLQIEDKRTFPVVQIGKLADLRRGSDITIVGFPAFVDGGITTTKRKTVPSATQGDIWEFAHDAGGHLLAVTDVPAAQGNSGGPAFNANGEQVGLLTYGGSALDPEAGKTKFSTQSIIRDVADFVALAAKHNITFNGKSSINDLWHPAIAAIADEDYRKAQRLLEQVNDQYGDHYLVASLLDIANEQAGSSLEQMLRIIVLAAMPFLIAALVIVIIKLVKYQSNRPPAATYTPLPPQMSQPQY